MYKLLITDDEALTREYILKNTTLLDKEWEAAGAASDGAEALKFLSENKADLVITDIKMPEMDGLELCSRIYNLYPSQKVIILSGYDEFSFAQQAIRYGVTDYLLKPIVEEELKAVLRKTAAQIESEKSKEQTTEIVSKLSEIHKKNIAKNIIKAIISDSNVEIKSLYPLIYKLRMDILESEGVIMILKVDKYKMLEKQVPLNNISIFKYLLDHIASAVLEHTDGLEFLDSDENVTVFLSGESKNEVLEKCTTIYKEVSLSFFKQTGITITGSIGSFQTELLQLDVSYRDAIETSDVILLFGGGDIYSHELFAKNSDKISAILGSIDAIKHGLMSNDEMSICSYVPELVKTMESLDISFILRYGIFLINSLKDLKREYSPELIDICFKYLQEITYINPAEITKDTVIKLYTKILRTFLNNPLLQSHHTNEQNIVNAAKDFIYSHYREPISLAQIAEFVGVTSNYLSNTFHRCIGESYIKFLTRVRMEQAAKLLNQKPQMKIQEISEKIGYVSVKHFLYVFKQHFNSTPCEYRSKSI
ncbi:MAG: response regulator [Bacillota bacterium]|nr:response regulator [Bacillota bacterium]